MTNPSPNNNDQKSKVVESLLVALYEKDSADHAQSLVTSGMELIGSDAGATKQKTGRRSSRTLPFWRWEIVILATAALILIAVILPLSGSNKQAMAAVNRSFQQALQDVGRHYSLTMNMRVKSKTRVGRKADLYVKGGERFAVRTTGFLSGQTVWLGNHEGKAWVVPPLGPVITGNVASLSTWVARREDVSTPYLHISTVLERMAESFELESLPQEKLPTTRGLVECEHIVGVLVGERSSQLPDRIELWADAKTGLAMKVVSSWNLADNENGRESVTIEFLEETPLSDEFFYPEAHGGKDRIRVDFDASFKTG